MASILERIVEHKNTKGGSFTGSHYHLFSCSSDLEQQFELSLIYVLWFLIHKSHRGVWCNGRIRKFSKNIKNIQPKGLYNKALPPNMKVDAYIIATAKAMGGGGSVTKIWRSWQGPDTTYYELYSLFLVLKYSERKTWWLPICGSNL